MQTALLYTTLLALAIFAWRLGCWHLRRRRALLIAGLKDCPHAVSSCTLFVEFPFLYRFSSQVDLLRTVGIPAMSRVLKRGSQIACNPSKGFDDSDILVREMLLHHIDSPRGTLAVRRLNLLHSYYHIHNDEYLYRLSLHVLSIIELSAKYGYREWTDLEKISHYRVWHDIAVRMGIRSIPTTLAGFAQYRDEYEAKHMVYHPDNQKLAEGGMQLLLDQMPKLLRPLVLRIALSLLDERALAAVGYRVQPKCLVFLSQLVLKLHGMMVRWMPPRSLTRAQTRIPWTCPFAEAETEALPLAYQCYRPYSYKQGYKVVELGGIKPGMVGNLCEGEILCPLPKADT
ncbi:hypothetical protein L7F22_045800 [Adiantum nelumboides]|nr:hypothetical protein [Adiantum nelumboides]